MLPVHPQAATVTLLPPQQKEAALSFDASSCIMGTSFAVKVPLPKNVYLLLDNSYSIHSSRSKIVRYIKEYFSFLSNEEKCHHFQHKLNASLFNTESRPVPPGGIDFVENLFDAFNANGYGANLAPGLVRVIDDWLTKIDPDEPYDNLLILITDGANQDKEEVKKIRETFISLLKTKNVALYIFGFDSISTAKSTIDNFTNFNDDDPTAGVVDSTLKINYFFVDDDESITAAIKILRNHRTVLRNAVVSLYSSNPQTTIRLVGFPNCQDPYPTRFPEYPRIAYFLGSPQISDLKSLIISIQGSWPNINGIGICIDGIDPAKGNDFSSGLVQYPLPTHPEINIETLLAVLPKLALEARRSKDSARQSEILNMIKLMKSELGDLPLLIENERYLENALKMAPATEVDDLLDAINSLSI